MSEPGPRLLFAGNDAAWIACAAEAADYLHATLDVLPTATEAIARILEPGPAYDHVLALAPARSRGIDAIAALLDEAATSQASMILLGGEGADTGMQRIGAPGAQALIEALTHPAPRAAGGPIGGDEAADALHEGALRMRFQPMLRARDLVPIGLEALARLHHTKHGILHPHDFIPSLIASGRERVLTAIVATRAFLDIGPALRGSDLLFSINVPLATVAHASAAQRGVKLCSLAGIRPERVIIEVLESRTAPDFAELGTSLLAWRSAGFHVAIDDAGPRLPHWRALLDLPFDVVKLDGAIVCDPAQHALVEGIVGQARARGQMIVAEGVESAACLERMRAVGVDVVQGFLFARPLPALAVPVWLESWRKSVLF